MTTALHRGSEVVPIVHLLLLQADHILLLKRTNTGYNDGRYGLIAGHKEQNEKATDAVMREAKEEAGITLQASDLNFAHVMHRLKEGQTDERIDLFFAASNWNGNMTNIEPEKHGGLSFFPLDQLPDTTVPFIRVAIANFRQGQYFSEFLEEMTKPAEKKGSG
ncbi:MAG: NUDIX domain-containing protein [Candidatus Andersenbacteria bacterium]